MPKIAKSLNDMQVRRINRVGWHAVGGVAGLLLQVRKPSKEGAQIPRSWILRVKVGDGRQPIGLGSYPQVSLAEAREQAKKLAIEAKQGINLKAKKRAERSALLSAASKNKTFKECAEAYMEAHSSDYSSDKHRKQWPSTLTAYAYPIIGNIFVSDISMRDVLSVLTQETSVTETEKGKLWYVKTETAKRLLGRIKTVIDYATVNEYRTGNNPAQWTGYLSTQLPSPKKLQKVEHHPAVPYQMIGDFISKLRKNDSISAKAVEFLILTAVRSGSVRQAEWSEIDYDKALWVIPAEHTKAKQEHRVPLQPQAIKLLKSLPKMAGSNTIFPSPTGKALSDMALSQLMRGMRDRGELTVEAVPHGFRSTFRDWAAEQTAYPDEIRKAASGHTVGDAVKEAYQRTDLLEKRRQLMLVWGNYCDKVAQLSTDKVTPIRKKINVKT
jgi:integrase